MTTGGSQVLGIHRHVTTGETSTSRPGSGTLRRLPRQDGAAAVEFGLLLPLLVMLAFGIIEFSTAYNRTQGMQAAVREGVRLASTGDVAGTTVEARVENTLQGNQGGAGFPDPGGSGAVATDVIVTTYALTEVQFGTLTDADPTNDATGTDVSSGTACSSGGTPDYGVRVVAEVDAAHRDAYGLVLPLIPGSPYHLAHRAEAVFRCL